MGLFKNNKKIGFIADVIRCDESEHLIWKWHPDGVVAGEHKREYSIRNGSVLRVREGEVAVFACKQKRGTVYDYIEGPFEDKLKTKNLPIIGSIIDSFWGGDTPFQAEIFFINVAKNVQVKFGVPYFDVSDYRFPDFSVPVAVRGVIDFQINDYKAFVKAHRLNEFKIEGFGTKIRDAVVRCVKNVVANAAATHGISVVQLERRITFVNQVVEDNLKNKLHDEFCVKLIGVDISAIEVDKSSEGYVALMSVTRDISTAAVKARAEADNENYAETLRINREADAYDRRMRTRTENIGAYSIEESTKVGVAGAEALGKMGESGAGTVDVGGASFSPAGIVAGMAIGSAVGEGLAGTVRASMGGGAATPPPVPTVVFYVVQDGVSTGPFEMPALTALIASGKLKGETLVWKSGMPNWVRADSVSELAGMFPPPIIT